jgi:hypothetical protein
MWICLTSDCILRSFHLLPEMVGLDIQPAEEIICLYMVSKIGNVNHE